MWRPEFADRLWNQGSLRASRGCRFSRRARHGSNARSRPVAPMTPRVANILNFARQKRECLMLALHLGRHQLAETTKSVHCFRKRSYPPVENFSWRKNLKAQRRRSASSKVSASSKKTHIGKERLFHERCGCPARQPTTAIFVRARNLRPL